MIEFSIEAGILLCGNGVSCEYNVERCPYPSLKYTDFTEINPYPLLFSSKESMFGTSLGMFRYKEVVYIVSIDHTGGATGVIHVTGAAGDAATVTGAPWP